MTVLCVDASAWHRSGHPEVAHEWQSALDADLVGACDQVRLEILYSARSQRDYEELARELTGLRDIGQDRQTFLRALDVQRRLARAGGLHHRSVKIADLVIAAAAEAVDAVVWHYDSDFDRIAKLTGQETRWIAPRGSLP